MIKIFCAIPPFGIESFGIFREGRQVIRTEIDSQLVNKKLLREFRWERIT